MRKQCSASFGPRAEAERGMGTEVRGPRSEIRGPRSEDRGQRAETPDGRSWESPSGVPDWVWCEPALRLLGGTWPQTPVATKKG